MKIEFQFKALTNFISVLLLNGAMALSLVISDVALAGAPFSNSDTPVNNRGWREMWNKEANKKIPRYDKAYQEGKKIYKGRGDHEKYEYCVPKVSKDTVLENDDNFSASFVGRLDKVKLNKKTVAPYRGLSVVEFASVLYDCNDPKALVLNKIERENAGLVIYYLHAHYHLKLKQEIAGGGKLAKIRDPHRR